MAQIGKRVKVTGECPNCKRKVIGEVTAIGPKGKTGDWTGTGICPICGKSVDLEKRNIAF